MCKMIGVYAGSKEGTAFGKAELNWGSPYSEQRLLVNSVWLINDSRTYGRVGEDVRAEKLDSA